ncbi:MAG: hypothetical protein C4563_04835 [Desulfobulbus sp.]|nr:MAG: hypothetical protein C4563_04835 [Desulfobulbus sp.]
MGDIQSVPGLSANLKKAVCWIGETVREHPDIQRDQIINEAELRFDLTPRECEFLNQNFLKFTDQRPC